MSEQDPLEGFDPKTRGAFDDQAEAWRAYRADQSTENAHALDATGENLYETTKGAVKKEELTERIADLDEQIEVSWSTASDEERENMARRYIELIDWQKNNQ